MTDKELMQMALDAFEKIVDGCQNVKKANPMHESARDLATFVIVDCKAPIKSISARLAQPELGATLTAAKHPVSLGKPSEYRLSKESLEDVVLERKWQGLTDEEILEEYRQSYGDDGNLTDVYFARAIEAKLKEKNG